MSELKRDRQIERKIERENEIEMIKRELDSGRESQTQAENVSMYQKKIL